MKLIHQQCQIEADLSLYNVLARENTCLLSLYAGDRFHINMWMIENSQSKAIRGFYVFSSQILTLESGRLGTWSSSLQRLVCFGFYPFFQQKLSGLRYRGRQQRVFVIICLHSHDDLLFASIKDDATIHLLVFITKPQDKNPPHEPTVIIL